MIAINLGYLTMCFIPEESIIDNYIISCIAIVPHDPYDVLEFVQFGLTFLETSDCTAKVINQYSASD